MALATAPHWLIVVSRDKPDLYEKLRRSFGSADLVEVVFDRRQGDRRRSNAGVPAERRRSDRRRAAGTREMSPAATYRLIQQSADGVLVLQSTSRVAARCPDCPAELEFEMPRFAEPPSRLCIDIRHVKNGSVGVQHYVEAEAFKATGRSLLACRILARRLNGSEATPSLAPQFAHA